MPVTRKRGARPGRAGVGGVAEPRAIGPDRREGLLRELPERLRRVEANPGDPLALCALSLVYGSLARLDAVMVPGSAREWLEKSLAVHEELFDLEPDDDLTAAELASALWRLARVLERDDASRARSLLVRSMEIREALAARAPRERHPREMLATTSETLGRSDARTHPARGRTWLLRALAIRERLVAENPADVDALRDLAFTHLALARVDDTLCPSRAARSYARWHAALQECTVLRPDDEALAFLRAVGASEAAEALDREGSGEAEGALRGAVDLWNGLASRRRRDASSHEGLARARHALAGFLGRAGRSREAHATARSRDQALVRAERLGAAGASFELFRARVLASRGEPRAALEAVERAVDLGLDDPVALWAAPELASLRDLPRFREACAEANGDAANPVA